MVLIIAATGGLLFAFIVFFIVYFRLIRKKRFELLDWFLLSLGTFNGIGFGFVLWATYAGKNSYNWTPWIIKYDDWASFTYLLMNILLLISVIFGWNLTNMLINNFKLFQHKQKKDLSVARKDTIRKMLFIAYLMFVTSVVSYWLYTKAYGGFIGIFKYSTAIRAGVFYVENPFSFLQIFGSFSFFSSFIFFGILIDKKIKKKNSLILFIAFILSFIFSLYVLFTWVGRVSLAVYVLTFFLGYILYNHKNIFGFLSKLIFFPFISLFLVIISDKVLKRSSDDGGILNFLTKELSFPFASYIVHISAQDYRWFKDLLVSPIYILPQRVWGQLVDTASDINTIYIIGARKGELGVTGSIPVDMLSFSIIEGSVVGVLLIGIFWGALLLIVERFISNIPIKGVMFIIYANIVLNVAILNLLYGDPQHLINRNFHMIIGVFLMVFFLKISFTINHMNSRTYPFINDNCCKTGVKTRDHV
ncbi:hypothetical protein [Saccharococcus caldoxylosilyticus]|uniref:Oligosaccharide repeat unit polymerase n=1 Tax=Parageobacillus caldoxylosilyticus NBRC 107762 TaxID=1220594 RepID=A0A023DAF0_9BACL|nr:hypothetical protein [Parageobacillus caldoxylosilyticus]MBB3851073.1 hypothetical protein [Parageobacillus caldoxylosilyticus]GAJ38353.1 hypothetical protein GCA01S_003_00190 [Parageobacillus caldoxylosilyticus NBRC 107762]